MTITYNGNTHVYAMFFAPLEDEALTALADDIKANGLINPITITPDGDLLDGRNRLAACKLAGVDPTFVVVDTDAAAFVLSSNDRRRHASTGARAASVALVLNAEGKRKNYRWERGSVPDAGDNGGSSISGWIRAMKLAGTVLDHLPELLPEVAAGRISLDSAYSSADEERRKIDPVVAIAAASAGVDMAGGGADGLSRLIDAGLFPEVVESHPPPDGIDPPEWSKAMAKVAVVMDELPDDLAQVAAGHIDLDSAYKSANLQRRVRESGLGLHHARDLTSREKTNAAIDGFITHIRMLLAADLDLALTSEDPARWRQIKDRIEPLIAILDQLKEHANDHA